MRPFVRTIANGEETRIACTGEEIFMRAATAELLLTVSQRKAGGGNQFLATRYPISARQSLRTAPRNFDDITVRNESGASATFTLLAGFGHVEAPLAEVSLTVPNGLGDAADVAVAGATASILAADATRIRTHVKNLLASGSAVRVGSATVTTTRGAQLQPGEGLTLEGTAEIFAVREGAASTLSITTEHLT